MLWPLNKGKKNMPMPLLVLLGLLLLPQPLLAQLDEPEGSCFEPVKPACAEVVVSDEEEGWGLSCREELEVFLEELSDYEQCIAGRIETMHSHATKELDHVNCLIEKEEAADGEARSCD